jgi:hypothetical protein
MNTDRITYQQLDELLRQLGFSRWHVEPKWRRYEHAPSDTIITLVEKGPHEPVRITDAVSARQHLVEKGLVTEEELEAKLSSISGAPKTVSAKKS